MNRTVYKEPRTYQKYDAGHIIGYLNEVELKDYQPESEQQEGKEPVVWPKAYQYEGTETDGGTVMPCADPNSLGDLVNAIIRSKYSDSQELAIHRHASNGDYEKDPTEFEAYNAFCENAVVIAKKWLANPM